MNADPRRAIQTPEMPKPERFRDATAAVDRLQEIYAAGTEFLCDRFRATIGAEKPHASFRAYYPQIRVVVTSYAQVDSRLSFGHVSQPGTYVTTVTRPDLFRSYLIQQIGLLIKNHEIAVEVGV